MIWVVVIGAILFILFRFLNDYNKDNYDLRGQALNEKFKVIVNMINTVAFNGQGIVTQRDKREFNLYREKENQIINFIYSTGNLTITWKYKYFQKEVIHERTFYDVRNLSLFEQQEIGEIMIEEMGQVVAKHKNNVLNL
ncbi:MAG: hypothetical protein JJ958_11860 [Balneola sp.]|nr:hypothetical protein [Balneola sp.]|tara:strand:- start:121 stop:537 length:417 start_codon:yes stop_codon:yes gene_type:complete